MYASITKDVQIAARFIRSGRAVAFPTGTAYGLAVDALQGHALQRLRNLKQRPQEKTFTVLLRDELLVRYFEISKPEQKLLNKYKKQPLTLLLKPKKPLAHLAQDGRVGLRVIDHPLMQALANAVEVPLTATSANVSGQDPCYSPECILKAFPAIVDKPSDPTRGTTYNLSLAAILDAGPLPKHPPTTIAKLENGSVEIIRRGALKL